MVRSAKTVPNSRTNRQAVPDAPSQTLDRGLSTLRAVALADAPMSIADVAAVVGVHRSIAYRLLRTLEMHDLIGRDEAGLYVGAGGLATLARSVRLDLRSVARPELATLADELAMTAFLVVREGDEAVTIESVEPTRTDVHVVYRPGARHHVDSGAPGLALLLASPAVADERAELARGRRLGWVQTAGEVLPGMASIAAPIAVPSGPAAAVAVLWLSAQHLDAALIGEAVRGAASNVAERLR